MAKRRVKKRTHVRPGPGVTTNAKNVANIAKSPKSMVIRMGAGEVGSSVSQLAKDVRQMMEPDTAARLKVCFYLQVGWAFLTQVINGIFTGTKSKQAQGLYSHGWSIRHHAFPPILQI